MKALSPRIKYRIAVLPFSLTIWPENWDRVGNCGEDDDAVIGDPETRKTKYE